MLIDAAYALFEHAVEVFGRVDMHIISTVLARAMNNKIMFREMLAQVSVLTGFAGHHACLLMHRRLQDRKEVSAFGALHMKRTRLAALRSTFDQCHHVCVTATFRHVLLLADKRLVDFNDLTQAAHPACA
jgi:hypothetical protein